MELNNTQACISRLEEGEGDIEIKLDGSNITVTTSSCGKPYLLLKSRNVREGTWDKLWAILDGCGDTEFRRD